MNATMFSSFAGTLFKGIKKSLYSNHATILSTGMVVNYYKSHIHMNPYLKEIQNKIPNYIFYSTS